MSASVQWKNALSRVDALLHQWTKLWLQAETHQLDLVLLSLRATAALEARSYTQSDNDYSD